MEQKQTLPTGQSWNAEAYASGGRFVADLASDVVKLLAPQSGEHILDIGCGDRALTEKIAATGAFVTGIDNSPSMLEAARNRAHNSVHSFKVLLQSAESLSYENEFDAVFSNAALHWLSEQKHSLTLKGIFRALKPCGRFVAEMGGLGNIAAIRTALQAILAPFNIDAETHAASFYPAPTVYRCMLEEAGFTVQSLELIPRPTPLSAGPDGTNPMETWLNTFRNGVLNLLSPADRAEVMNRTIALLKPILSDSEGNWTTDYVRLRFHATRS